MKPHPLAFSPILAAAFAAAFTAGCATARRAHFEAAPRSPASSPTSQGAAEPGERRGYGAEPPEPRSDFERRALAEVLSALRRGGGAAAVGSAALDRAASSLAPVNALGARPDTLDREAIQAALRAGAAFDPAPRVHVSTGSDDEALAALLARVRPGDATHVGLAAAGGPGRRHVVLLLSRRKARLDPFPSSVEPGSTARLSGALVGLLHPRLFVTRPDGSTAEIDVEGGAAFSARVPFTIPGTHLLEVTGTGPAGTEVVALLAVAAGTPLPDPTTRVSPLPPDPADPAAAEEAVVAAVNALRQRHGLAPVSTSVELAAVARAHGERMLAAGIVAHVLPGSAELADRLAGARIAFSRAFENVARGESALAAHAAAEASPAHRANLLAPGATLVGVGIARGALSSGEPVVYLAEILLERPGTELPDRMTPDARVREWLWRERERRGLPPLTADPALEALARDAARAAREVDGGETGPLAEAALRLGRRIAAADAFVASIPAEAVRSRNLTDPRFRRVGVGVVSGESRRYGPGKLFIAVVYSD